VGFCGAIGRAEGGGGEGRLGSSRAARRAGGPSQETTVLVSNR
jgi:hypothetical protein